MVTHRTIIIPNYRLVTASCLVFALVLTTCISKTTLSFDVKAATSIEEEAWNSVRDIIANIKPPKFQKTEYNILDYGAKADSTFDSRSSILEAIRYCHEKGGGRVIIPNGVYYCKGPIHLKSKVNLHLEAKARLVFDTVPANYLPLVKVRWEGTVCWNYSPLIYAYRQTDIAITGAGTIDGQATAWSKRWRELQKPDKDRLRQMGNDTIPENERVFGNGFLDLNQDLQDDGFGDGASHYLRPTLIEFYECSNVLIEDVTLKQSPFWTVHPVFCNNVTIRNIKVYGQTLNDDGIDPDSCEDVLIEDCYIQTHDDAISIKAGRDQDAWNRPGSQNIIIRRCILNSGVNSFCIGSEMSGGVKNIFVEDCHILTGRHGMNFKCNLDRGGQVERIFLRNIKVDKITDALFIFRMDYHGYRGNNFPTKFNDFYAQNISCKSIEKFPFKIIGVEEEPISRISLKNITIDQAGEESIFENVEEILLQHVMVNDTLIH